ncbi:MAG: transglycosylase SLT domain-containing protein, partial [Gammaproteobacteria bacterium]|nr:transglycosylase SLT domain-containing protein [Gammaproteobacteria bacterium]
MPAPIVTLFLAVLLVGTTAAAGSLQDARKTFLAAEKALRAGDQAGFDRLRRQLRDYPLRPYLDYAYLRKHLGTVSEREVVGFLDANRDTPLAGRLQAHWLDHLGRHGKWAEYLTLYDDGSNVTRRCHYLHALIDTGRSDEAMPQVAGIWLHGRSRPKACDPVFAAWEKAGWRTDELTWQRIEKAMLAGEWRLAKYLKRTLPTSERAWVDRWVDLYQKPDQLFDRERFRQPHPYREAMLAHTIRRMARWDGETAMRNWQRIAPLYRFSDEQVRATEQYIVRNLVRIPGDDVYAFIRGVDMGDNDTEAHDARIRAALMREDWRQVLDWIAALPAGEREDERWQYWRARALEGAGEQQAADAVYREVAKQRSYYGFLAADRIGEDYHLHHADTPVTTAMIDRIADRAAVGRASELFALERWTDARREWRWATRDLSPLELKAAAELAQQRGWHDRAIFTLAKTGYWDDLELRFPLAHADVVEENARRHGIDDAWVFAVMRQESAFMQNARSHAGAMGLMQLMPATARNVARDMLNRKPPRRSDLYRPDTNIALGSAYLKQMQGELGGSPILATAAYNAGPHRVSRWLPPRVLPADIWIELVPFHETRGYLRRVLAYTVIYEKRM